MTPAPFEHKNVFTGMLRGGSHPAPRGGTDLPKF